ncbi:DJ-1/PfpI family protein [Actinospica sp. MGRD01-02]|uniref:DJ-1/PfpI family protein n=1 Tax=Actinospica acidithermotolerans TaxID=2828514 RepID=A0A941EG58_9ACTN|nr:DJ-1/PfpI family protein [Actinospica acidithermotolerans]MBR7830837.1 DJ-1/PfpI family protein [Actinospica acidithermotolerans]
MDIVIPLFPNFTALDAIGPYEVLRSLPGARITFAAAEPGLVHADNPALAINAAAALSEIESADVLVVPGGGGTRTAMKDETMLAWIRRIHATTRYTTSVCSGSLVLGGAGLLDGLEATTHWSLVKLLESTGAKYTEQRVVQQGKIVTAAGVSSGIDMALTLAAQIAGDDIAKALQLGIEYDPQPPFDAGSPAKAGPEIVALTGMAEG